MLAYLTPLPTFGLMPRLLHFLRSQSLGSTCPTVIISHLCLCLRTYCSWEWLRRARYRGSAIPFIALKREIGSNIDASSTDGCRGWAIFGPCPCVCAVYSLRNLPCVISCHRRVTSKYQSLAVLVLIVLLSSVFGIWIICKGLIILRLLTSCYVIPISLSFA